MSEKLRHKHFYADPADNNVRAVWVDSPIPVEKSLWKRPFVASDFSPLEAVLPEVPETRTGQYRTALQLRRRAQRIGKKTWPFYDMDHADCRSRLKALQKFA